MVFSKSSLNFLFQASVISYSQLGSQEWLANPTAPNIVRMSEQQLLYIFAKINRSSKELCFFEKVLQNINQS